MDDIKDQEIKVNTSAKPPLKTTTQPTESLASKDHKLGSDLGELQKRIAGLEAKISLDKPKEPEQAPIAK